MDVRGVHESFFRGLIDGQINRCEVDGQVQEFTNMCEDSWTVLGFTDT